MKRSKVLSRAGGYVSGNSLELTLDCGHVCYVSPFGRYAQVKTITCPACEQAPGASPLKGRDDE